MTKKDYEAVAKVFAKNTNWTQYLYCSQGFMANENGIVHSDRGQELWSELKDMDKIVFDLANSFKDLNPKFDREKFLAACGMQTDGSRYYSFVPTRENIDKVRG